MSVLSSWLGAGGTPVAAKVAESRAMVCVACPKNVELGWWDRMVKDPIAKAIRKTLMVKGGMNLRVSSEHALGLCKCCGCCNALKVWVPIEHIKSETTEDFRQCAIPECWVMKEINQ